MIWGSIKKSGNAKGHAGVFYKAKAAPLRVLRSLKRQRGRERKSIHAGGFPNFFAASRERKGPFFRFDCWGQGGRSREAQPSRRSTLRIAGLKKGCIPATKRVFASGNRWQSSNLQGNRKL